MQESRNKKNYMLMLHKFDKWYIHKTKTLLFIAHCLVYLKKLYKYQRKKKHNINKMTNNYNNNLRFMIYDVIRETYKKLT